MNNQVKLHRNCICIMFWLGNSENFLILVNLFNIFLISVSEMNTITENHKPVLYKVRNTRYSRYLNTCN